MQITTEMNKGKVYKVEIALKFSDVKLEHVRWLLGLYDYMKSSKDSTCKGFENTGFGKSLYICTSSVDLCQCI